MYLGEHIHPIPVVTSYDSIPHHPSPKCALNKSLASFLPPCMASNAGPATRTTRTATATAPRKQEGFKSSCHVRLHQETIIWYATAEIPNPTRVTGARAASRSLTTSADSPGKVRGYSYMDPA